MDLLVQTCKYLLFLAASPIWPGRRPLKAIWALLEVLHGAEGVGWTVGEFPVRVFWIGVGVGPIELTQRILARICTARRLGRSIAGSSFNDFGTVNWGAMSSIQWIPKRHGPESDRENEI